MITEYELREANKKRKEEKNSTISKSSGTLKKSFDKKMISSPTNFKVLTHVKLKDNNQRYEVSFFVV